MRLLNRRIGGLQGAAYQIGTLWQSPWRILIVFSLVLCSDEQRRQLIEASGAKGVLVFYVNGDDECGGEEGGDLR